MSSDDFVIAVLIGVVAGLLLLLAFGGNFRRQPPKKGGQQPGEDSDGTTPPEPQRQAQESRWKNPWVVPGTILTVALLFVAAAFGLNLLGFKWSSVGGENITTTALLLIFLVSIGGYLVIKGAIKNDSYTGAIWVARGLGCVGTLAFFLLLFTGLLYGSEAPKQLNDWRRSIATLLATETEWMEFTAPTAGNEPLAFYRYEGWAFETRYPSKAEGRREELVGAIYSQGKWYFPGGLIQIRSKDNRPLQGWIKFTPI